MATTAPTKAPVKQASPEETRLAQIVQQSYGRCCVGPKFFDDFYDAFVKTSPKIREKFTKTDFVKQKKLLRQSITFIIMFYTGSSMADNVVRDLGQSHSRKQLDIDPSLYTFWIESLVQTIKKSDPKFTPELEAAWRKVLDRGVNAMKSAY